MSKPFKELEEAVLAKDAEMQELLDDYSKVYLADMRYRHNPSYGEQPFNHEYLIDPGVRVCAECDKEEPWLVATDLDEGARAKLVEKYVCRACENDELRMADPDLDEIA